MAFHSSQVASNFVISINCAVTLRLLCLFVLFNFCSLNAFTSHKRQTGQILEFPTATLGRGSDPVTPHFRRFPIASYLKLVILFTSRYFYNYSELFFEVLLLYDPFCASFGRCVGLIVGWSVNLTVIIS